MKMHIEEESAFGCCWQPSEKIYQAQKVMCIIWMHLTFLIITPNVSVCALQFKNSTKTT